MKQYLIETWQLFYWAMYFPSKLQQRMNEWSPRKDQEEKILNTEFSDILLTYFNLRFSTQFLLLLFINTLPLIITNAVQGQQLAWLQGTLVIVTSYSLAVWFLPTSLFIPLILWLAYLEQPDSWLKGYNQAFKLVPPLYQLAIGVSIGTSFLVITTLLVSQLLKRNQLFLARIIFVSGGTISVVIGCWLATKNVLYIVMISLWTSFLLFFAKDKLKQPEDTNAVAGRVTILIAGGVGFLVAGGVGFLTTEGTAKIIAFFVAGIVGLFVAGVIGLVLTFLTTIFMGLFIGGVIGGVLGLFLGGVVGAIMAAVIAAAANLSLPLFIVACWLISFSLSYHQGKRLGLYSAAILTTVSFENLGFSSLLVIPVVLVTYYRIFPDYLFFAFISLLSSLPFFKEIPLNPIQLLYLLPPHSSEIYWLPLPNHDHLLAAAFRRDFPTTLLTVLQMRVLSVPGFQRTLKHALSQIIADLLAKFNTIALIQTFTLDNRVSLLLPAYYQSVTDPTTFPYISSELSLLFPRFQIIAQDVAAALEPKSIALRERGLERILNNISLLQAQLPGLGLNLLARQRWEPVIIQWQKVIQNELEAQQQQSQGELLNPFQFGNPLRLDRDRLFKGRQKFADDIVRLILDRNRPTLVLHAPRRFGKTSFLYNLPRLLPSDLIPIYLDMQSAAVTTDDAAFCYGLVRAIHKDSGSQGIKLPTPPNRQDFLKTPYIALEDWLNEALVKLGDRRLLLNLDEFEKIGTAIKEGKITLQLFDQLRHLIQHYEQLGFLFSGVQTLDELGPNWSSYFISVVPIKMLYLEPQEAEELLVNPDPDFKLRYDTGIVEEVLRLTRCHPYLVQLLGSAMVTQANLNHVKILTSELLEAAIQDALTNGEPYFTNIWTEFTGTTPTEVEIGQQFLLQLAKGENIQTEENNSIKRLLRFHLIERIENHYDFEVPLIKMWVNKKAIYS